MKYPLEIIRLMVSLKNDQGKQGSNKIWKKKREINAVRMKLAIDNKMTRKNKEWDNALQ